MIEFKLKPVEHNEQRVLTTAQLAEAYGTNINTINRNFSNNKSRYIEGIHYYRLTGDELKEFFATEKFTGTNLAKIRVIYLWTERGALLHAKSLNTKKAWEVYEYLVDTYFRVREISKLYDEDIYKKLDMLEKTNKIIYQKLEMSEKTNKIIYQKLEISEKRNDMIYQELEILKQKIDASEINIKKSI
ncbi:MAG: ORF6N domain-containing protein, partial [Ruminococcus sp.]|nr:ORF6N domain-containing protein [Ruminococcus sp.]